MITLEKLKKNNLLQYVEDDEERIKLANDWLDSLIYYCEIYNVYIKEKTYKGYLTVAGNKENRVFRNLDRKYSDIEALKMLMEDELVIQKYVSLYDELMDK